MGGAFAASSLLTAKAQEEIELPGVWSYTSTVSGGKGYTVNGTEYIYLDLNQGPNPTYAKGNTYTKLTDKKGNQHTYSPNIRQPGLLLSPYLSAVSYYGGGSQVMSYDLRKNLTKREFTGTDGTSKIDVEFGYDTSCDTLVTCNKPIWTKDGKNNQTTTTYDNTHGGVLTVTKPAVGGVSPQTRYVYQQFQARFKNSSGSIVASGEPIWLLTQEKYCITSNASGSNCAAGASDEVVTAYDYGPTTGANNLWLRGTTVTAGGVTKRTCFYYDDFGNKTAETQPKAGMTSCY